MMNLWLFYSYGRRIGVAEGTEFEIALGCVHYTFCLTSESHMNSLIFHKFQAL